MTATFSTLALPPAFTSHILAPPADAFALAVDIARRDGAEAAGALVLIDRTDVLDLAVVLAPAEPLASARRAFLAGMVALADAVGAHGPPEMPLTFVWPDVLVFDGARLGGGRLGWPEACAETDVPDWLVFSAMLIVSKAGAGDPGLTPASTALEDVGFPAGIPALLVESFARNLVRAFDIWAEDGFAAVAGRYLNHLPTPQGVPVRIGQNGDAVLGDALRDGATSDDDGSGERWPLAFLLREPGWRDPVSGSVRL